MKKILITILVLISIQSFGQMKTYFRRLAANGVIDSGYLKPFTDSVFSFTDNSFVSLSIESFYGQFNPVLPNQFSNFKKGADDIWSNYIQRIDYTGLVSKPTTLAGYGITNGVVNTTTVNGKALNANISVTASDVGLDNVTNESKATMFTSPTFTGTVSGVTKAMVGLGNADNTSDANKPVSTSTQAAINLKQDALVSGTNIKTVNGNTLLGSGDVVVGGGATSSTSGVAATATASGTQTITHNLGRTPTIIRIYSISNFTSSTSATPVPFSMGVFNSSGNRCVYMVINGTTSQASQTSTVFSVIMVTSAGNQITGVIGNVTNTSFDITWSETGTHTAGNFLWEAQ